MVSVTGRTAASMASLQAQTIVDAHLSGDNLILEKYNGSTVNVGSVRGATGAAGAPGADGADGGAIAVGTYTPTWTGITVGTAGSVQNTGGWTFVGEAASASPGLLTLRIAMRFGSTSPTLPSATAITVSIPSGFNLVADADSTSLPEYMSLGEASFLDSSATLVVRGLCAKASATTLRVWRVDPTTLTNANFSSTAPFTWAAADGIDVFAGGLRAVRT